MVSRSGMCAACLPTDDDDGAVGNEGTELAELEVGEGCAEPGHEDLYGRTPASGIVHRVLQEHVGCGQLVDDGGIVGSAPERGEPPSDDRFVQHVGVHDAPVSLHAVAASAAA